MSNGRKILLYVVYFLTVVAFVTAIIFVFVHHDNKKTAVKAPASSQGAGKSEKTQAPSESHSPAETTTPPTNTQVSDAARAALNEAVKAGAAANTGKLANTGPGDSLALFAGVTVVAAFIYRFYLVRRLS